MGDADGKGAKMSSHKCLKSKGFVSIRSQLRLEDVLELLWETDPFPLNILSMPYNMFAYNRLLKKSRDLTELKEYQQKEQDSSRLSGLFMPRYQKVKEYLNIAHEIL